MDFHILTIDKSSQLYKKHHMQKHSYLSIKTRKLSVCVCVCVRACVRVCVPEISLQIRIRLTWEFQHGCCMVEGCATPDLFRLQRYCWNKWFNKWYTIPTSIVNHSHAPWICAPQSQSLQSPPPRPTSCVSNIKPHAHPHNTHSFEMC